MGEVENTKTGAHSRPNLSGLAQSPCHHYHVVKEEDGASAIDVLM